MHDARARLQRTEEVRRMIRRIAEEQRDRGIPAVAGAQVSCGRDLDHRLQLGVADRPVAEFDRRTGGEFTRRLRQQLRQRPLRDRIVPVDALRIKLLAGMAHGSGAHGEVSTTARAPLPLAGRGWGRGSTRALPMRPPPSLTLPRKGGGNGAIELVGSTTIKLLSPTARVTQRSCPRRRDA